LKEYSGICPGYLHMSILKIFRKGTHESFEKIPETFYIKDKNLKCIPGIIPCGGELILDWDFESECEKLMCKTLNTKKGKIGIYENM
jgi:hypothetical protein